MVIPKKSGTSTMCLLKHLECLSWLPGGTKH
uniref:Uncharacterized protein n=1 Tax=Arundo donax TaxID=35708 RepID=A0A0A9AUS6_ARUDO